MKAPPLEVTQLLKAWEKGDEAALERLAPLVQSELHRLARRYLAGETPGHTLQPTALINEAWLRLIDWHGMSWQNRAHFFGVSAQFMRHILVDYARRRANRGRMCSAGHASLDEALQISMEKSEDLVSLDDALRNLTARDPRKGRIVELRFFGGLSEEEIAGVLDISTKTVQREWNKAKAWLYYELENSHLSRDDTDDVRG